MTLPNGLFSSAALGFWALAGAIMKSGADWRDPETKKFSVARLITTFATAAVMGQGAATVGGAFHWDAGWIALAASTLGYLGPAVAMPIFEKLLNIGGSNGKQGGNG